MRAPARRRHGSLLSAFLAVSVLAHGLLLILPRTPFTVPLQPSGHDPTALEVRVETPSEARAAAAPPPSPRHAIPAVRPAPESTPSHAVEAAAARRASPPPPLRTLEPPSRTRQTTAIAGAQPEPDRTRSRSRSAPRTNPVARPSTAPERTEVASSSAPPAAAPTAPATAAAEAPEPSAATAARVRARLDASLRAQFHYPRIARQRGWEGEVELGLRVEANGRLSGVRVLRTSGFAVLDRAALASIGRITRLPEVAEWLGGHHIDMVLPVQYRLIDG